eukprot:scaffold199278_cov33-Tisochrysis_lutea.AAC.1
MHRPGVPKRASVGARVVHSLAPRGSGGAILVKYLKKDDGALTNPRSASVAHRRPLTPSGIQRSRWERWETKRAPAFVPHVLRTCRYFSPKRTTTTSA